MKKMDSITTTTKIGYAMLYTLKNINLPNVHPENKAINKMAENYEKEFLMGSRR
jgi:hypothetical protein